MPQRTRSIGPAISEQTGRRIRRLRVERGWTYRDLSLQIHDLTRDDPGGSQDISTAVLYNIENGILLPDGIRHIRRVTVDEAVLLARVFGVSVDYLVAGAPRTVADMTEWDKEQDEERNGQ